MKKKVFLKTVLVALVSFLLLMGCSHSSSGSDHYLFPDGEGGYTEYNYIGGIEEAVSYIGELTDEGTCVVKVIDTSETSCSSLKEALDALEEGVLVCLDLSETSLKIGGNEFEGCENLLGIALPKMLKEVGSYAFYDCINLKEVYIPDSVTRIGEWAFAGSYNSSTYSYNTNQLKTVTLPKNLTVIEMYTFCGCQNLETVYLPDSLEYIDYYAFYWCEKLTTLTKDGNNKLPKSLKTIGEYVFCRCTSLKTIYLSETQLKEIPAYAFCMVFSSSSSLTKVYLPDTIESIGEWAFNGCSSLTSLIIEKESGKAWGYASTAGSSGESNPSASDLTMIPCFEENAAYFLAAPTGVTLQCGASCCQGDGQTCCGEEGSTCACAEITNTSGSNSSYGYNYWWYKVAYPAEEE